MKIYIIEYTYIQKKPLASPSSYTVARKEREKRTERNEREREKGEKKTENIKSPIIIISNALQFRIKCRDWKLHPGPQQDDFQL